ncbi:transglutaminase-like domain-containing protein [Dyadobacter diqingensis]|uniref:transglutaminase-like domain-containing protein n=1 Tax=Dyadobacter diqingensis TaxID=2938121 RepID=UPI0020C4299A|nr:transglutaminase-like domain-containing protein [Dyadobacter diqingensis]
MEKSFQQAKNNKEELKRVINHYKTKDDTIGYIASIFLIENMKGLGTYDSKTDSMRLDLEHINADYLISNIDASLKVSRLNLIKGNISQTAFLEYILPYRLEYEGLSDWRKQCLDRYNSISGDLFNLKTFEEQAFYAVTNINNDLIDHFKYTNSESPAEFNNWQQLITRKSGDCWAMTNTITYPLRAMGIPTTIDFITSWGNSNGGGHAWNTLILKTRKTVPFLGFEASPPNYNPFKVYKTVMRFPAKIFRKTFSMNPLALSNLITNVNDIPVHLRFDRAIDVTDQYLSTKTVKVYIGNRSAPNIVYLSVFSNGQWQPVCGTPRKLGYYFFDKMVENILYIPTSFDSEKGVKLLGYPFFIRSGIIFSLKPNMSSLENITIGNTRSLVSDGLGLYGLNISKEVFYQRMENLMSGINTSKPLDNVTYKLFYWDGSWVLHSEVKKIPGKNLVFYNVPKNALLRLISPHDLRNSRIFSYKNGQVWW